MNKRPCGKPNAAQNSGVDRSYYLCIRSRWPMLYLSNPFIRMDNDFGIQFADTDKLRADVPGNLKGRRVVLPVQTVVDMSIADMKRCADRIFPRTDVHTHFKLTRIPRVFFEAHGLFIPVQVCPENVLDRKSVV